MKAVRIGQLASLLFVLSLCQPAVVFADEATVNARLLQTENRLSSSGMNRQARSTLEMLRQKFRTSTSDGSYVPATEAWLIDQLDHLDAQISGGSSFVPPGTAPYGNPYSAPPRRWTSATSSMARGDEAGLHSRLSKLNDRVSSCIHDGSIPPADGPAARADIEAIRQKFRDFMRDGILVPQEEAELTNLMNNIDNQLNSLAPAEGPRWGNHGHGYRHQFNTGFNNDYNNGNFVNPAATNDRKAKLSQQISTALANGDISRRAAERLQQNVSRIDSMQMQLQSDGGLSRSDRDKLENELNSLSDNINKEIRQGR